MQILCRCFVAGKLQNYVEYAEMFKGGLQETREVCNNGRGLHKREGLAKTIEDCKNEKGSQKRERRSKTIAVGKNERSLQNLGHSVCVSGGKEGFMKMPNQTSSNFKTMINT